MNEIKSGLPPANSVSYGSSPKRPTDGVETSGHLQTAHGEMTVVQIKPTQMTTPKPQLEHEGFSGSAVNHRLVTVAGTSSPEQTAKDLKTIEEATDFFLRLQRDPRGAVAALNEQLKSKGN